MDAIQDKNKNKDPIKSRRRGKELEAAIMQAVREELNERGYFQFTMEGVAERSGTSKAVLYRRWTNRAEIVLAAVRERIPLPLDEIPNHGNLRDDVCDALRSMNRNASELLSKALFGLVMELGTTTIAEVMFPQGRQSRSMSVILQRAIERGELPARLLTEREMNVPIDLARHELMLYNRPMSEETIAQIVDEVFLPLVTRR
ncbi:TetR/AcrR family transcriptional regulator [Paenibacillus qinlingensis]|uniref:AcrR family transcriptional regulator n=1 Tax=Paenibacillus qinlingensis TaxID=1837343 RepID=A0ABU1NTG4_9BACL|nr:TetR/AcrR family transcriptional regulator [Paenibacillus qinlingensis]MDR6550277.1 AcrR family transcriptional regulator [Paenibacillus qinlingensis]